MFGSAFFAIPGLGPILVAGPLVASIVGALEGAAVGRGLSALGAGLYSECLYCGCDVAVVAAGTFDSGFLFGGISVPAG
jgi:hypothetical protein